MRTALVPGSFDPMTLGHRRIVERALKTFDRVIVAVMINKDKQYMFSMDERLEIARRTVKGLDNVFVIADTGFTADIAAALGATALVKGIRDEKDFEYELDGELFNRRKRPEIETVYLRAEDDYAGISSTYARSLIMGDSSLANVLAPEAIAYIREL